MSRFFCFMVVVMFLTSVYELGIGDLESARYFLLCGWLVMIFGTVSAILNRLDTIVKLLKK